MRSLALLLVVAVAGACAPTEEATSAVSAPSGSVVVARVMRGVVVLPEPAARLPAGSQVVRIAADGTETVLSVGLVAAGAPAVHHDGKRVLFVGRRSETDPFAVFECAADGRDLHVAVMHGTDCVRADYLPDGRIVYAAALPSASPLDGVSHGAALFVADGEGGAGARITFGAGLDTDPAVLSDGRIVFSSWRPRKRTGSGRLGLFTVHPDGTGYAPFHLPDGHAVMPRQHASGDVHFTLIHDAGLRMMAASWDAPMSVVTPVAPSAGLPLAPRRRPQGHLSSMRDDRAYGTLVCVDARSRGARTAHGARFSVFGNDRALGVAPLEEDGSFMARVPADTPLMIELLDAEGSVVAAEHGPFWVRNNEVRICVSCHDDVETGPPNARPAAVLPEPVDLTGGGQ